MNFVTHSHQHADAVLLDPEKARVASELYSIVESVSDDDLIQGFLSQGPSKSISRTINELLKERLTAAGWIPEAAIFQDNAYMGKRWRLDFAKKPISVEVAFNHGEAIAWNLIKPVLASRMNHVKKDVQTEVGIVICATEALKTAGNFDSAVGEYEKFIRYLLPLQEVLTAPILLIGLVPPKTFHIEGRREGSKSIGYIVKHENY